MAVTADFNEQNIINGSLVAITNNNIDAPNMNHGKGLGTTFTPLYVTRTILNSTTGQTENDTVLVIN